MNLTIQLNAVKVWAGVEPTQITSGNRNRHLSGFFTSIVFYGRVACNHTKPFEGKLQTRLVARVQVPDHPLIEPKGNTRLLGVKNMTNSLSIGNFSIRQFDGLYSLNDLHKASGGLDKHSPRLFLRNAQTQALIEEIEHCTDSYTAVKVKNGGHGRGTYVCKEIAIAYAMWVSASFMLIVIRTFDAVVTNQPIIEHKQTDLKENPKSRRYFIDIKIVDNLTGGKPINIQAVAHDTNAMVTCFANELGYRINSLEMIGDAFAGRYNK